MKIDSSLMNPSTGLLYRNPSHIKEAENAANQGEIYNTLKEKNRERQIAHLTYEDPKEHKPLMGITKFRGLSKEETTGFFIALMRSYPNILGFHLRLGVYPEIKEYKGYAINPLNGNERRFAKMTASLLSDLFSNAYSEGNPIVEVIYSIKDINNFRVETQAFSTTKEHYTNDALFAPEIAIEFVKPA